MNRETDMGRWPGRAASACAVIGLAACVVGTSGFWQSDAPFIVGADSMLRLPLLSHWHNAPIVFSPFFTSFTDGQYRPLSYALLGVLRTWAPVASVRFWQLWFLGWHALCAVLVYAVARRLTGSRWGGLAAGAVFALHPIGAEVANHADRFHYALGLALCLGSLLCYLRSVRTGSGWSWACSFALFGAALLTTKIAMALPVVVCGYEFARRGPWRHALLRWAPLAALVGVMTPVWWTCGPSLQFYAFTKVPAGTWWRSLVTVMSGLDWYVRGLLGGAGVPMILEEVLHKRYKPGLSFVLGSAGVVLFVAAALWLLWRNRRRARSVELGPGAVAALGMVWCVAALAPVASMGWNLVDDYMAWPYLYFPTAGVALAAGAAAVACRGEAWRRVLALAAIAVWVGYLGAQLAHQHRITRSAASYWREALALNPKSERASVALGKAYLRSGDASLAIRFLFSPTVVNTEVSCQAMAGYYIERGNLLAAAIHCQGAAISQAGIKFQTLHPLRAKLLVRVGALDFAEANLGQVLLANPYRMDAVAELARIWQLKGHVAAARRLVAHARDIDPLDPRLARLDVQLRTCRGRQLALRMPSPKWLRYFITAGDDPGVHRQIVALSDRMPADPMIQLAAGVCLAKLGEPRLCCEKLAAAEKRIASSGLLWATKCYALVQIGAYPEASQAAKKAMKFGKQNAVALCVVGTALLQRGRYGQALKCLQRSVQLRPNYEGGRMNFGLALQSAGQLDAAARELRAAIKLGPTNTDALVALGATLMAKGQLPEAIEALRQALKLAPKRASIHVQLGTALARTGDRAAAAKHFAAAERLEPGSTSRQIGLKGVFSTQKQRVWAGEPQSH